MNFKKNCFFCTTPFQVLTSIILAKNLVEKSDIYIANKFPGVSKCVERLKSEDIFDKISIIYEENQQHRKSKYKFVMWFRIVEDYLNVDQIAEKILIFGQDYNKMYTSSTAYTSRMVQLYFTKHNTEVEIIYYDDGAGSYYDERVYTPRWGDRVIRRFLFGKKAERYYDKKLLYSPELYRMINGVNRLESIVKIPEFFNRIQNIYLLNRVFDFTESDVIKQNCILLDGMKDESFSVQEKNKLLSIYEQIIRSLGTENLIIKQHPRDKEGRCEKYLYYENMEVPFECLCMNSNMDNKMLVTVSSTAIITPKVLLNQEPYVILLYKLVNEKIGNKQKEDHFFRRCKELYVRQERFVIPNDLDELYDVLNKFKEGNV